jgi:hypothetical protein
MKVVSVRSARKRCTHIKARALDASDWTTISAGTSSLERRHSNVSARTSSLERQRSNVDTRT